AAVLDLISIITFVKPKISLIEIDLISSHLIIVDFSKTSFNTSVYHVHSSFDCAEDADRTKFK
ncbi:hypothetical protein L9F63_024954, partial [Diploptera punctata]